MTDLGTPSRRQRRTAGAGLLLVGVGTSLVVSAAPASAHVSVQPGSVPGGGYAVVSVRVPNERDDAATTRVRVLLPSEQPLASVQTTPVPGWRATTAERELDEPLEVSGSEITTVVSQVTWTAVDGGVQPGQFQDFPLSLGQLPDSGELVLRAVQTYSSGERVAWNEVGVGGAEPEHPAPVLTLIPAGEAEHAVEAPASDQAEGTGGGSADADTETAAGDDGTGSAMPIGLSLAALVTAVAALAVGLKRRTV